MPTPKNVFHRERGRKNSKKGGEEGVEENDTKEEESGETRKRE